METYEKKYKEALERAREWYNNSNSSSIGKSYLYAVFPELKESEDEKIRKALMKFIEKFPYERLENDGVSVKDALAWLEKQGEQKPQRMVSAEAKEALYGKPSWSEEDEIVEEIIDFLDEYTGSVKPPSLSYPVKSKWCTWLKSLKQRIGGK